MMDYAEHLMRSGNVKEGLNYEFKWKMFKTKSLIPRLEDPEDRDRTLRWLEKLSEPKYNVDDLRERNQFLDTLYCQVGNDRFAPPFTGEPPTGPIFGTPKSPPMRRDSVDQNELGPKPFINQFSPDGGAFLATQPIPRCGAFCYLAVTSRDGNRN